jgi:hypothetical protein
MVPIAVTLCFGLAFGTALVLLVVPAMIVITEQLKSRITNLLSATRRFKIQEGN